MNREDALKQSEQALEELADALAQGRSDTLVRYLEMLSRFHHYSFGNCMLIALQQPDIVLAGTTLPQVSGYDLARFMRGKAELRGVPVLLLTGAFETIDEARLASSGANGVIEKPVEPRLVINRVKELLGMKTDDQPAQAGRPVAPADGRTAEKHLPPSAPSRPVTSSRAASAMREVPRTAPAEEGAKPADTAPKGSDDYLDALDAAFDSLDQQLSGRAPSARTSSASSGACTPATRPGTGCPRG